MEQSQSLSENLKQLASELEMMRESNEKLGKENYFLKQRSREQDQLILYYQYQ